MEQIVWKDDTGSTLDYREAIVRCQDCKYYQKHHGKFQQWRFSKTEGVCKYHNYESVRKVDFCSRGEK